MKRFLLTLPFLIILAFLAYRQFFLKPEIQEFKLLDLPWTAYCDFYKNKEAETSGQAIFAFPADRNNRIYIAKIDGEMQEFSALIERRKGRNIEWVTSGNNQYSISLKLTDHSDVEEIQLYSGSLGVSKNGLSTTVDVVGRCGS